MSDNTAKQTSTAGSPGSDEPLRYPENTVVGVIETVAKLEEAIVALESGGFLASEIEVMHGPAAAKRLSESTGRKGFAGLAMRLIASIGLPNDETEMKNRYAEALEKGWFLIAVQAPTEERKQRSTQILQEHGGQFVNFLGRFTIQLMRR